MLEVWSPLQQVCFALLEAWSLLQVWFALLEVQSAGLNRPTPKAPLYPQILNKAHLQQGECPQAWWKWSFVEGAVYQQLTQVQKGVQLFAEWVAAKKVAASESKHLFLCRDD